MHMVFITEGFLEVAIESWPEWDLNPRPLNSVQTPEPTELSDHEFNTHSEKKFLQNLKSSKNYRSIYIKLYLKFKILFIKKLPSFENRIYTKNPFGVVIETAGAGCKFVTFYC